MERNFHALYYPGCIYSTVFQLLDRTTALLLVVIGPSTYAPADSSLCYAHAHL